VIALRAQPGRFPYGAVYGAVGVAAALGVGLLHLDRLPFVLCRFKAVTGLPCPTCGATRTFGRLFALDLPGAFAMNPLIFVVATAVVVWALADAVLWMRGRALTLRLPSGRGLRVLRAVVIVAVVVNWAWLIASGR
jgi:hypothetical protein